VPKDQGKNGGRNQRPGVVQEAWQNMMRDFDHVLPEQFKGGKGKKKFVLWLFILELIVIGLVGKLIYSWAVS